MQEIAKVTHIDFCELLIDNFLLYDPEIIKESLPTAKCAFHIMHSHFLHRDLSDLLDYGKRIRKAANILKPIYISDHIGIFDLNNRRFPTMQEVSYSKSFDVFKERACFWSDLLEQVIYYENFPSFKMQDFRQVDFFLKIKDALQDQANILFDFSNAIISEKNGCESAREWTKLARGTNHFHVGGYEKASNIEYYLDSHNQSISHDSYRFMADLNVLNKKDCTLTVERDSNLDVSSWIKDIDTIRGLINASFTA
jgi:uncharacterized protein (UPF0276 family)